MKTNKQTKKRRQHLDVGGVDPEKWGACLSKVSYKALSPTLLQFFSWEEKGKKKANQQLEVGGPRLEFQSAG